ncbi:DUF4386 domain-containing protein [Flagellimonas eckloniae]|uniref:DUF4386 domain-containing protein n=1 Tax=Flagellimonas eckloniae TaxID=346185 RepID=A0A0Q0XH62_9FLAO|nr:DUF4386 domain-containing protein [Allomuricauda eckloniae]KQC30415.1 hypothetical protein AAY42_11460 [Allomuricauda eckloniae]
MKQLGPNKKTAHLAGLLYFLVVLTGIFSLLYVPSRLIVSNDPVSTIGNIQSFELLFRSGILAGLLCYIFFLLLPLVLYKLFESINKNFALVMVVLAIVSVPISFVNMIHKFDVLALLNGAEHLAAFTPEQIQSQVMLSLKSYSYGNLVAQAFWGLWLFPFGYLVFKSGFLPKFLGLFLMIGSCGYFLDFAGRVAFSNYGDLWVSDYITIPASIGEIGTCLWLLIMGIRLKKD